jgi:hypothetical protein
LKYLTNAIKKRCTAFLISDFIDPENFKDALTIANKKHDVAAVQVYDERDTKIPSIGLIKLKDAETGKEQWIDTSSAKERKRFEENWTALNLKTNDAFIRSKVDAVSVKTNEDYVKALMLLFAKRV